VRHYRRTRICGATYFFTVVTFDRRPILNSDGAVRLLEGEIAKVRNRHPFKVEAQVVLPDHLHAIWTLPEDTHDFSTRWMLIKAGFSRAYARLERVDSTDASRPAGASRPSGSAASGSMSSATMRILRRISTTFITIR
jgi:putative transposase